MNCENDTSPVCRVDRRSTIIKPGDQGKVSARGTFVFTVNDIDEDTGMAMIEVDADSPLTYPWPARLTDLVAVED
ncbi:hypothetical protein Q3O43_28885 (plasmid) [Rhodococcus aetherivorans]|uniref:hypothetical protein n=1 Tax=Rhodococcus aetherivorans TaxID=191292 RepID=UPI00045C931A|nr:hypothetical protein [Rhodococcus aetherivorans]KDE09934.1 hypothetical protein N505_0129110 [Rhodococcus aetherivorans]MBC2592577.1 hypothetical protein [Rhodococcus aetherivorans]WKX01935.1 hypothetical protein Q3O43_28885 [Rhodococcus aetherivorans]